MTKLIARMLPLVIVVASFSIGAPAFASGNEDDSLDVPGVGICVNQFCVRTDQMCLFLEDPSCLGTLPPLPEGCLVQIVECIDGYATGLAEYALELVLNTGKLGGPCQWTNQPVGQDYGPGSEYAYSANYYYCPSDLGPQMVSATASAPRCVLWGQLSTGQEGSQFWLPFAIELCTPRAGGVPDVSPNSPLDGSLVPGGCGNASWFRCNGPANSQDFCLTQAYSGATPIPQPPGWEQSFDSNDDGYFRVCYQPNNFHNWPYGPG